MTFDPNDVPSPCYVVDTSLLEKNLVLLRSVQERTGCKILLALKGFAMFSLFPLIREYLVGTSASSLDEARLGHEEFGREVHVYAPAYSEDWFPELLSHCDHIVFNSFSQWQRFRSQVAIHPGKIRCGLRVNPQYSEIAYPRYNPCVRFSRLGIPAGEFAGYDLTGISGLHFHSHCEQNSDVLARTMERVEASFGSYLQELDWLNMGGGHHITRPGYDVDALCGVISRTMEKYRVEVYLEPGEAIALKTGFLVATVLDVVHNEMDIAILDTSATAHMPDVLEMPYRPEIIGAGEPGELAHTYRLGGMTCLAGDIIGDYSFAAPLQVGTKLVFTDMGHYTMVKNTTFNGVRLPSIAIYNPTAGSIEVVRRFGYEDYRNRLS